ncbi:MAG: hypothetical protein BGO43_02565 [Gammaproteobacteria bacterium 39-13]|mgnify:CR=1 FL=1|nr:hypothetical protein [Gammaproteobacteria bacterium]OJV91169.1 MAG: hypothetical protein BGO43_02565 [Gammaproteobacteria bacterium 39-13]
MAKTEQIPGMPRITTWQRIKKSFASFVNLELAEGFGELIKAGGEFVGGIAAAISGQLIYEVIKNSRLKTWQKVLYASGYGITLGLSVAAAVVCIVGASLLVPPFIFIASVASTARRVIQFLSERSERINLKKELITTNELTAQINKSFKNDIHREKVLAYAFKKEELYSTLYHLRASIIKDNTIPLSLKKELIEKNINIAIENLSKGILTPVAIDSMVTFQHKNEIQLQLERINDKLQSYNAAKTFVENHPISEKLKKQIDRYQQAREKIVAQNLPEYIKDNIIKSLEDKKIDGAKLKQLYATVGNHYLNETQDKQLAIIDGNLYQQIDMLIKNKEQANMMMAYYQMPRTLYDQLHSVSDMLGTQHVTDFMLRGKLEKFIRDFKDMPDVIPTKQWEELQKELDSIPVLKQHIDEITNLLAEYKTVNQAFTQFKEETPYLQSLEVQKMYQRVAEKQLTSLEQYVNLGLQFASPTLEFQKEKPGSTPKWHLFKKKKLSDEKQALQDDFNNRYHSTFDIIKKKERLNFLKKMVPRRIGQIATSVGISVLSFVTSLLIPAVASPAAPAAATATIVLGAITTALTVACAIDSADVIRRENNSKRKVLEVEKAVKVGVVPTLEDTSDFSVKESKVKQKVQEPKMSETKETSAQTRWNPDQLYEIVKNGHKHEQPPLSLGTPDEKESEGEGKKGPRHSEF